MMGTKNMLYDVYKNLSHDPLMHDPVQPTSLDSVQKQGNKAWFVKDGIRFVHECTVTRYSRIFISFPCETFYFFYSNFTTF